MHMLDMAMARHPPRAVARSTGLQAHNRPPSTPSADQTRTRLVESRKVRIPRRVYVRFAVLADCRFPHIPRPVIAKLATQALRVDVFRLKCPLLL